MTPSAPDIRVLTWNVYVGARIESLLSEREPHHIPHRVAEIWRAVQETDFPARAAVMAAQIASARPHLVGLQEMSLFRVQSLAHSPAREATGRSEAALDFLSILMDALQEIGASYRVAARVGNFRLEVPIAVDTAEPARIRLTDYDVILARSDVRTSNPRRGRYRASRCIWLAGHAFRIRRGWVSVDAAFAARPYRFVNTHLEPADAGGVPVAELVPVQAAQAAELGAVLDAFDGRTILVGDLNSAADGATTTTYADLVARGFVDVWLLGASRAADFSRADGFTSNQDPDLRNPESKLFHRIDFILYRDPGSRSPDQSLALVQPRLVGADPTARTESGLWPSDHAGVLAILRPARK